MEVRKKSHIHDKRALVVVRVVEVKVDRVAQVVVARAVVAVGMVAAGAAAGRAAAKAAAKAAAVRHQMKCVVLLLLRRMDSKCIHRASVPMECWARSTRAMEIAFRRRSNGLGCPQLPKAWRLPCITSRRPARKVSMNMRTSFCGG